MILADAEITNLDQKLGRYQVTELNMNRVEVDKLSVLKRFLDQVADDYDYIFIDCPPNVHLVTQNAIFASDYYLIPALPDHLSSVGISTVKGEIDDLDRHFRTLCTSVGQDYQPTRCIGIVFNKVNERLSSPTQIDKHYMDLIRKEEQELVFNSYLVEGHGISEAARKHHPVYAYFNRRNSPNKSARQIECLEQILEEFAIRIHTEVPR